MAAQEGHLDILKFLIQEEPQVVDLKGWSGRTPLIAPAKRGHLKIVKYLLSHPQVEIDSQAIDGTSPLMTASFNNHKEVVQFLEKCSYDKIIFTNPTKIDLHSFWVSFI